MKKLIATIICLSSFGLHAEMITLVSSNDLHAIDCFVQQNQADTAHDYSADDPDHSTDAVIQVDLRMRNANSQGHGLLSFHTLFGSGANQIPLGSIINSATLSLWYVNDNKNNDIAMYRMTSLWGETATWNSIGGGIISGSNATASRTVNWGSTDPVTVSEDVAADLSAWSAGTANYGWGFVNSNANGLQFAATENTTGTAGWHTPTLTVDYTVVPEPSSAMLMGVISLVSLWIRRRFVD